MSERKWSQLNVYFDNGTSIRIDRRDFDKLEEIAPILEALNRVRRMQHDVNRLLGEAED